MVFGLPNLIIQFCLCIFVLISFYTEFVLVFMAKKKKMEYQNTVYQNLNFFFNLGIFYQYFFNSCVIK